MKAVTNLLHGILSSWGDACAAMIKSSWLPMETILLVNDCKLEYNSYSKQLGAKFDKASIF